MEYLKRMVGADHVMVGTDYPFDLGDWKAAEKIRDMECTSCRARSDAAWQCQEAAENRLTSYEFHSRQSNLNVADN